MLVLSAKSGHFKVPEPTHVEQEVLCRQPVASHRLFSGHMHQKALTRQLGEADRVARLESELQDQGACRVIFPF